MTFSQLLSTGIGFPPKIMKNSDFESFIETTDEWIQTRTGIKERRVADPKKGETTLSLCHLAAKQAIERAQISAADIGLIIIGTVTPNTLMPSTANQLQALLGAHNAFSFDLSAACSGFIYAWGIADQFIRQGQVKHALILGAETLSTIVNWRDRATCVLFGDGAGAAILSATSDANHRIYSSKLYADGRGGPLLCIPHGFSEVPPYTANYRSDMHKVKMTGSEIFKLAVRSMNDSAHAVLKENNFKLEEVDYFIFHQANMRIIDMCIKNLGIDPKKTWCNVDKYGNTSSATLPVALHEAIEAGQIKKGNLVLMTTFGGGLTWGSTLFRV